MRWEAASLFLERARYSRVSALWRALYLVLILGRRAEPVLVCRTRGVPGDGLSLAVAGSRTLAEELSGILLAGPVDVHQAGRLRPARARTLDAGTDLEAVRIHPWHAARWRSAGWTVVPRRVRFELDLRAPWRVPSGRRGRALANDLRKVARGGFGVEAAPAREALAEFRARMVVPYAVRRFGSRVSLWIGRSARRGTILFVVRDGVRLAGALLVPRGDTLLLPRLGVLDGRTELVQEGVLAALYLYQIEWARARGFRTLDAGLASALTSDGINRWKRKWGFVPKAAPLADPIAFRALTEAGGRALANLAFPESGTGRS